MLRLAIGEFATAVVNGQRVMPKKLMSRGFNFEYPDLQDALDRLLRSPDID
jgi:NAD dependent epimerase/dehydratase family enzyme